MRARHGSYQTRSSLWKLTSGLLPSLLLSMLLLLPAHADEIEAARHHEQHSQRRAEDQDYRHSLERYLTQRRGEAGSAAWLVSGPEELDLWLAPNWPPEAVRRAFELIRDERFLTTESHPFFERRISWLYPDEGCYARAAVSNQLIDSALKLERPAKLFAFGNLSLETEYAWAGKVHWWFHVAPVVRSGEKAYVLDPSINPHRPISIDEWVWEISSEGEASLQVCSPYTYFPGNLCYASEERTEERALLDQERFLDLEWERLEELGRDPMILLGDFPPWQDLSSVSTTPVQEENSL